jgi:hypothetical protein
MDESSAVAVGLDVHASSIRLAAVRGDELLDERTLAYDLEAVARCLRRWPGVRCCYEAGPTAWGAHIRSSCTSPGFRARLEFVHRTDGISGRSVTSDSSR